MAQTPYPGADTAFSCHPAPFPASALTSSLAGNLSPARAKFFSLPGLPHLLLSHSSFLPCWLLLTCGDTCSAEALPDHIPSEGGPSCLGRLLRPLTTAPHTHLDQAAPACRVPSVPGSGRHVGDAYSMAAHCQLNGQYAQLSCWAHCQGLPTGFRVLPLSSGKFRLPPLCSSHCGCSSMLPGASNLVCTACSESLKCLGPLSV